METRVGGKDKRQSEWTELSGLMCIYVIIGCGDEEQCYHSHQHLQVKVLLYGREQRQTTLQTRIRVREEWDTNPGHFRYP